VTFEPGLEPSGVALTSLSHGAGCGCKLAVGALMPILQRLPRASDPRLLVGNESSDDAAVVQLAPDLAIVQTVDFFTPIVDDPYDFGRIAAANALSDVYAMGATPVSALNLVAFPLERLGAEVLEAILRGGNDVVAQAGGMVVGGHSIDDPEPKYGLAVTGVVHPERMLTNAGGRADDVLVLTKPLGVGAISTAHKHGTAGPDELAAALEAMVSLNAEAAAAAVSARAHAATDVTGYGLLVHLHELATASGVAAVLDAERVPALAGVEVLLGGDGAVSGGSRRNRAYSDGFTTFAPEVPEWRRRLVNDATTSGGLLIAVPPDRAHTLPGVAVGRLVDGAPGTIDVR
jgi:selenide, water dikinase